MDLTFEQTNEKFSKLIYYMANKFIPIAKQVYNKEDFYQDSSIVLYDCWLKYKEKSIEEFKTILSVSLRRLLSNKIKKGTRDKGILLLGDIGGTSLGNDDSDKLSFEDIQGKLDDNLNNVYIQDGLDQLKQLLKDDIVALAILEELLQPSQRTVWELNMDKARKKMLHSQGHEEIRPTSSTEVRMHHIARALNISLNDVNKGLKIIREQAYNVFK